MKSKFLKIVLPAFAFFLAIGLSFAHDAATVDADPAYYDHPVLGVQPIPGGSACPQSGVDPCMYNGHRAHADQNLTTPLFIKQQ